MHLYALTLQRGTAITAAIHGNFSAPKQQEIVVARGKILELLRPDEAGKLQSIHVHEVFGIVRSIQPFRLLGASRRASRLAPRRTPTAARAQRVRRAKPRAYNT